MQLTLNVKDIEKLVITSSYGEVYRLVPLVEPEPYGDYLTRTQVRKQYRWGDKKVTRFISEGLKVILDGEREYFDRRDIDEFLDTKKF